MAADGTGRAAASRLHRVGHAVTRAATDELPITQVVPDVFAGSASSRSMFEASPVGMSMSDEHGHFIAVNEALCRLMGRSESQLLGHSAAEFTHPEDQHLQAQIGGLLGAAADGVVRIEKRFVRPDGDVRWGWLTLTHVLGPVGQTWTLAHMQDITERKSAEQALIESEANLTAVANVMHRIQDGADARQAIVEAASAMSAANYAGLIEPCTDAPALYVSASTDPRFVDERIPLTAASATVRVFRTGEKMFLSDLANQPLMSPRLVRITGARTLLLVPVSTHGRTLGVLAAGWRREVGDLADRAARAITLLAAEAGVALRQTSLLAELNERAHTDPLTRLPNRRGWDEHLTRLVAEARRAGTPLTVAIADLDHFKQFNDAHGHSAGDRLLADFARRARTALRDVDIIARWGGEEFALALPNCSDHDVPKTLERLRRNLPERQTCSIGYATWDRRESIDELLDRADAALYLAKRSGRDRVCAASHADPAGDTVTTAPAQPSPT